MSFLKILVIGDVGTGKTSLVNRIVYNNFTEKYKATIGCEFGLKIMDINGEAVRIQLWDLAGQDRLGAISRLYCRDASGALVISDMTREDTIDKAAEWKAAVEGNVKTADSSNIPMILCLNKYDMIESEDRRAKLDLGEISNRYGYVDTFHTSAKTGMNANEALERLVRQVLRSYQPKNNETGAMSLKRVVRTKEAKKSCC